MMRLSFIVTFLFIAHFLSGQEAISISEGTLKVGGVSEEVLYFGLSEGDKLVFNFKEVKGKALKEIEIIELPGASKFFEYKSNSIKDKSIQIQNTGIYKLRLKNSAIGGRICQYKLARIPVDPNQKFNTTVYWKEKRDTTYYTVQEDYLVSKDTAIVDILGHKVERVHSQTATNGRPNKSIVQVTLPEQTVSWSYYIGVGEDAEAIFQEAEEKAIKRKGQLQAGAQLARGLASGDPTGSLVLASVALSGLAELGVPDKADNVQYWLATDYDNAQLFMLDQSFYQFEKGNGPLSYKRMESPKTGTFYICLLNDNLMEGIDVHIRISAVTVRENWGKRPVRKFKVKTWEEPYLRN